MAGVDAIMSTIKVFALGGLDQKSNDLTRAVDKASDMVNLEYDTQSTIKKRNGFAEVTIDGSTVATFDDIFYYNTKDEIIGITAGQSNVKVLKRNGSDFTSKTLSLPSGIPVWTSNPSISYCENQNNIYFTNTDFSTYVMKYDGDSLIRAGLPTPRLADSTTRIDTIPTWSASLAGFARCFYSYKDINGNITYSPYVEFANSAGIITINSLKTDPNCYENGFFGKYCYRTKSSAQTISNASLISRTLNTTKHNYVVGDKFLIDTENKLITIDSQGLSFIVLEIESVVPNTSITFTSASFNSRSITFAIGASYSSEYPVDIRCQLWVAFSTTQAANYYVSNFALDNSTIINTINTVNADQVFYGTGRPVQAIPLTDVYDDTYLKEMPPICKYVASYGNQIVYANIQAYFTVSTSTLNAPNQRIQFANTSLITYSDKSTGEGPEGTSDFNFVKIGETFDGDITGLRRCNDSLVIFKNRGVFTIDGELIDGQFQLRKINTNFAGCTAFKSILDADEGLYFQAHNGIYFTNGINVKKISYEVDSLFQSGTYLNTRAVRLKKKQKSLFFVPDIVNGTNKIVIVDYYYNQIYMWNLSTLPTFGIIEDKDGNVYFCDGSKMFKFNDTYTDNGTAITSLYSTTWHHAGEPSLNKKWLSLRTWGLTSDAFTAMITCQGDWDTTSFHGFDVNGQPTTNVPAGSTGILTANSSVYSTTTQTDFKMLDMQTKKALRINFSNSTNNENMVLTGYELTYEMFNVVDKN